MEKAGMRTNQAIVKSRQTSRNHNFSTFQKKDDNIITQSILFMRENLNKRLWIDDIAASLTIPLLIFPAFSVNKQGSPHWNPGW